MLFIFQRMYTVILRFKEDKLSQDYIGCLEFDFEFDVAESSTEGAIIGWTLEFLTMYLTALIMSNSRIFLHFYLCHKCLYLIHM